MNGKDLLKCPLLEWLGYTSLEELGEPAGNADMRGYSMLLLAVMHEPKGAPQHGICLSLIGVIVFARVGCACPYSKPSRKAFTFLPRTSWL